MLIKIREPISFFLNYQITCNVCSYEYCTMSEAIFVKEFADWRYNTDQDLYICPACVKEIFKEKMCERNL